MTNWLESGMGEAERQAARREHAYADYVDAVQEARAGVRQMLQDFVEQMGKSGVDPLPRSREVVKQPAYRDPHFTAASKPALENTIFYPEGWRTRAGVVSPDGALMVSVPGEKKAGGFLTSRVRMKTTYEEIKIQPHTFDANWFGVSPQTRFLGVSGQLGLAVYGSTAYPDLLFTWSPAGDENSTSLKEVLVNYANGVVSGR